jgi:hypothetical protein
LRKERQAMAAEMGERGRKRMDREEVREKSVNERAPASTWTARGEEN